MSHRTCKIIWGAQLSEDLNLLGNSSCQPKKGPIFPTSAYFRVHMDFYFFSLLTMLMPFMRFHPLLSCSLCQHYASWMCWITTPISLVTIVSTHSGEHQVRNSWNTARNEIGSNHFRSHTKLQFSSQLILSWVVFYAHIVLCTVCVIMQALVARARWWHLNLGVLIHAGLLLSFFVLLELDIFC